MNGKKCITQKDSEQYEMLQPLLYASYREIQELSKKKPDTPLNALKVKMINRILVPLKEILSSEDIAEYIDLLSDDELPTNSDAVLILSQYLKALEAYKEKYYQYNSRVGRTEWKLE